MNMFDDETPTDAAKRVGEHAAEKIKTDLTLKDCTSEIEGNKVRLKTLNGSTLDIICRGKERFSLEDRHDGHSGVKVMRSFNPDQSIDERQMVISVKDWFHQNGKR